MIYIQLIGLLAFCILVLSFYKKNVKVMLIYQVTANLCYFIHYFLLGGLTGAFLSLANILRNIVFLKSQKKAYVPIFILIYLLIVIIFYENIWSILPMVASSAYLVFMPFNNRKYLIIGEIISASLWLLYAVFVLSYSGIITEFIMIVSNSIQLKKIKD